jgi:MoaA/NifB/PqqE/SkfB family radical SAM enzyme
MIFPNLKKIIAKKPRILNLFQFGRGFASFPLFYLVHLTLACNVRCPFCYQNDSAFDVCRKDFLKIDNFELILRQAKTFIFKRPLIHFFGGEPLLHPQFADFLAAAEKFRFPCALTTNGILLAKYMDEIAAAGNLRQINISLYGAGGVHDRIVGLGGVFDEIISNIKRLQEAARRKKIININCAINKENFDKLRAFAGFLNKYFKKREIGALVFQYPMQKEICREIDNPVFKTEIEKLKKIKFGFDIYFMSERWFNNYRAAKPSFFKGNCNLLWLGLGILPNLDVLPGGSVLTCSRPVGNLKEKTIKEIWNSQEIKSLRKQILKRGLPSFCWGCCHARVYF